MTEHPRLYVTARQLRRQPLLPSLQPFNRAVARLAEEYVRSPKFDYPVNTHNAHLTRVRFAQTRIVTLLVRYFQTGRQRYRRAAMEHVREIQNWEYWSWIAWRKKDPDPNAIFDLSYGENSATLALAFDWLFHELTASERADFLDTAQRRSFRPFLKTVKGKTAWWFKKPQTNWNSVCVGGVGMLALALAEELPETKEVLKLVGESMDTFFDSLEETDGAWPEGIGYWNYGMRYAFMYLLSHENATGRPHPVLSRPAVRASMQFPLDFCPRGVPCSFGDANSWQPLPFYFAVAHRLRTPLPPVPVYRKGMWPDDAELVLLYPRRYRKALPVRRTGIKLYRGQDWGILRTPALTLTVRGGTTEVPHGHRDLLSFHAVVGDEALITNLSVEEYLDTTFGPRRYDLFETAPPSKNTLLINGVGISAPATVATSLVSRGLRMDATKAMGVLRDGPAVRFCGRLFLLLGAGALIVDRVELPHVGRVEARFHTFAREKNGLLTGERHRLGLAFASDVPSTLHRAVTTPTTPGRSATVLRWCADEQLLSATFATWLTPGRAAGPLSLQRRDDSILIRAGSQRVVLTARLKPKSIRR